MSSDPRAPSLSGRLGSGAVGTALGCLAVWIAARNLSLSTQDGYIFWVPVALWLLTMSALCWWSALAGAGERVRSRIGASWRYGWIAGAVGLVAGFVGPLVAIPGANLGPLLGILLTGPGGFVLGAAAGALRPPRPPAIPHR